MSTHDQPDDELQQQLLELAYDLLADDEAADLRQRIQTDPAVAQAHADALRTAGLLRAASSLAAPPIDLVEPLGAAQAAVEGAHVASGSTTTNRPESDKSLPSSRPGVLASLRLNVRTRRWAAAIAAVLLVGLTLRGYLFSLARRGNVDAPDTHLAVVNPPSVPTSTASVNPQPAEIVGPVSPHPAVQPLPPHHEEHRVEVVAINQDSPSLLQGTSRPASPALFTQLTIDRPVYQPGDTLYYRSLTLHRFSLDPADEMIVDFEVRDPGGALVPDSNASYATEHAVASGSFSLGRGLPGGQYTLYARSASGQFAEQKRTFFVRQYRLPRLKKDLEFTHDSYAPGDRVVADVSVDRPDGAPAAGATLRSIATVDGKVVFDASRQMEKTGKTQVEFQLPRGIERGDGQLAIIVDDGGTQETIAKTIRINVGRIDVSFFPEGGELVAGLENRVYFVARNPLGKPVHIAGKIVDSTGRAVAQVKTAHKGMGSFSFTPQAAENYALKLSNPPDVSSQPALPAVNRQRHAVLSTGPGVFEPSQPLTVELRSDRDDLPLTLAAYCRDVLIGQQMVVVHKGSNRVTVPLAGEAGGVVRLTLLEQVVRADAIELSPIAERLVYRRPSRALNVKVTGLHEHYAPGESVKLSLAVTNERGQATPAVLGVSVIPEGIWKMVEEETPKMTTQFYLTSEIEKPEDLEKADFYLSDDPQAPAALDLLLGTQGWRRFVERTETALAQVGKPRPTSGTTSRPSAVATMRSIDGWQGQPGYSGGVHYDPVDFRLSQRPPRATVLILGEQKEIDGTRARWLPAPSAVPEGEGLIPTSTLLHSDAGPSYRVSLPAGIQVSESDGSGGAAGADKNDVLGDNYTLNSLNFDLASSSQNFDLTVANTNVNWGQSGGQIAVGQNNGTILNVGSGVTVAGGGTLNVNGGKLALGNGATLDRYEAVSPAIGSTLSGGTTTKTGTGTLTLSGSNTYDSDTNWVNGITTATGALGNNESVSGTGNQAVLGTANLTIGGSGTQTLAGNNTYGGVTSINAGKLQLGSSSSLGGGNYAGNIVLSGGTLQYTSSANQNLSGIISGSGDSTLSGANTYNGGTNISGGALAINNTGASASNLARGSGSYSGTISNNAAAYTVGGVINTSGVAPPTSSALGSNALTVTGGTAVSATGGGVNIGGSGTITGQGQGQGQGQGIVTISSGVTNTFTLGNSCGSNSGVGGTGSTFNGDEPQTFSGVIPNSGGGQIDSSLISEVTGPQPKSHAPPSREYAHLHTAEQPDVRSDFAETLLWQPMVITDAAGQATVEFELSDAVTTFRVVADAHSHIAPAGQGRIGTSSAQIVSRIPVSFEPTLPLEVNAGDRIDLPVAMVNDTPRELPVALSVAAISRAEGGESGARLAPPLLKFDGPGTLSMNLPGGGRKRVYFPLAVVGQSGTAQIEVRGKAGQLADARRQSLGVVPAGYPVAASHSGSLSGQRELKLRIPRDCVPGSLAVSLRAFPSPLADIQQGIAGILQEPSGCFEQTSASNYPNVLALEYLQEQKLANPELTRRAKELLRTGYDRLTSYECRGGGFEWFGRDPAHEALTAYGLMEFREMARVVGYVDPDLVKRTAYWLLSRRDGHGSFLHDRQWHNGFSEAPADVVDAYIVWALSESGQEGLDLELKHAIELGRNSSDPYLIALTAASALDNRDESDGRDLLDRLMKLQEADGHLTARDGSITCSGGISLDIETTSLAALAWMKRPDYWRSAKRAVDWIVQHREGSGGFGSTQATVLALKVLVEDAKLNRKAVTGGELTVERDGHPIGRAAFAPDEWRTIRIDGLAEKLAPGDNFLTLNLSGDNRMTFALDVSYRSLTGPSDAACPVRLTTKLSAREVRAGETVALEAELVNTTDRGQPMTIAILGLPAGLQPRANQLEELKKSGAIDYYETRAREVVCYWRSLSPRQRIALKLDLVAEWPGQYTGPASRAYLYYTAERKQWSAPLQVSITHD